MAGAGRDSTLADSYRQPGGWSVVGKCFFWSHHVIFDNMASITSVSSFGESDWEWTGCCCCQSVVRDPVTVIGWPQFTEDQKNDVNNPPDTDTTECQQLADSCTYSMTNKHTSMCNRITTTWSKHAYTGTFGSWFQVGWMSNWSSLDAFLFFVLGSTSLFLQAMLRITTFVQLSCFRATAQFLPLNTTFVQLWLINSTTADRYCHGNEIWDKISNNSLKYEL